MLRKSQQPHVVERRKKKRAEVQELDVKVVGVLSVVPVNGKIKWEGKGREGRRQIEK